MRKRIISPRPPDLATAEADWLPIEQIAAVEVTSEEASHPIEHALLPGSATGWRASEPGKQTIRLIFDHPQALRRIHLVFIEAEVERSQEFVLRWSPNAGHTFHEIVRQQWNFNPQNSTQEVEDYHMDLTRVTQLELNIVPDRGNSAATASLAQLRLA